MIVRQHGAVLAVLLPLYYSCSSTSNAFKHYRSSSGEGKERKGKERKGKERKGKERKGKERKGKERKGRKGKERKGKAMLSRFGTRKRTATHSCVLPSAVKHLTLTKAPGH